MPSKCLLILLDGLGDRSYPELNRQTPLQAASTPNLDSLAAQGATGLYHATTLGQALPSEIAHFALFGYDLHDFPGRGALEALGAGLTLQDDEIAMLAHFALLGERDNALFLKKNKPPNLDPEFLNACFSAVGDYVAEDIHIRLVQTKGAFAVLTMQGAVSPYITDTDPMREGAFLPAPLPLAAHAHDPAAQATARALKEYLLAAREKIIALQGEASPPRLSGIVTQRPGKFTPVQPFSERYGLRGAMLASGVMYAGLGRFLGLDVFPAKDTDAPGRDFAQRLFQARDVLQTHDFIHVHTKAPDQAAHTKSPQTKMQVIEALDRGLGEALPTLLDDPEILLIVTADHSTPSSGPLIHSGESVPIAMHGRGVRVDDVTKFDEIAPANGALGHVRGGEVMLLLLNHLERARLAGIMDAPAPQLFWPGDYPPFRIE